MALKLAFFPFQKTVELINRHAVFERSLGTVADALPVKREADRPPIAGDDEPSGGVAPQVELDSFYGLSLGLKAFDENLAGHQEYGSVEAQIGGMYDVASQLTFRAARFGGSRLWVESVVRYESEPALLFQGIGTDGVATGGSRLDPRLASLPARYQQARLLDVLRLGYTAGQPGRVLQLGATGVYSVRSVDGAADEGPSVEAVYDTRQLPGFDERVSTVETQLNVTLNTLEPPELAETGVYVDGFFGRVPELAGYGYWHAGVDAIAYLDLYHGNRVLLLRALAEVVDGERSEVPFADLPSLGGPHRLRGYAQDRFRDEQALLGSVEYHYPIHQYIAGSLFFEAGKVERALSSRFDAKWKASFGGGFFVRSREKQIFSCHVAYGDALQFYLTTDPWRVFSKRETEL